MIYNTWKTPRGAIVIEIDHDADLHAFAVEYGGHEVLVVPGTIEEMTDAIRDLHEGACPIDDGWEDGNGRTLFGIFREALGGVI